MGAPRLVAILAAGLLALVVAGCGGGDAEAPQVPGPPAEVAIPESAQAPESAASSKDKTDSSSSDSSSSDSSSSDSSSTPDSSTSGSTGTDTGTATGDSGSGGSAAPDTGTADSQTNDTAPPAGSDAQQFEDFCAQNPGAC